jgi:hypothetical protein
LGLDRDETLGQRLSEALHLALRVDRGLHVVVGLFGVRDIVVGDRLLAGGLHGCNLRKSYF